MANRGGVRERLGSVVHMRLSPRDVRPPEPVLGRWIAMRRQGALASTPPLRVTSQLGGVSADRTRNSSEKHVASIRDDRYGSEIHTPDLDAVRLKEPLGGDDTRFKNLNRRQRSNPRKLEVVVDLERSPLVMSTSHECGNGDHHNAWGRPASQLGDIWPKPFCSLGVRLRIERPHSEGGLELDRSPAHHEVDTSRSAQACLSGNVYAPVRSLPRGL